MHVKLFLGVSVEESPESEGLWEFLLGEDFIKQTVGFAESSLSLLVNAFSNTSSEIARCLGFSVVALPFRLCGCNRTFRTSSSESG